MKSLDMEFLYKGWHTRAGVAPAPQVWQVDTPNPRKVISTWRFKCAQSHAKRALPKFDMVIAT